MENFFKFLSQFKFDIIPVTTGKEQGLSNVYENYVYPFYINYAMENKGFPSIIEYNKKVNMDTILEHWNKTCDVSIRWLEFSYTEKGKLILDTLICDVDDVRIKFSWSEKIAFDKFKNLKNGKSLALPTSNIKNKNGHFISDQIKILYNIKNYDKLPEICNVINDHLVQKNQETTYVNFITAEKGAFSINEFDIGNNITPFVELDLHYGDGFKDYYNKLLNLIINNNKGLILFHGKPGTGKTYCIKNLMRDLRHEDKLFIYVPSDMIENVMDPSFMKFLTKYAVEEEEKSIILIIEDADVLLQKRDEFQKSGVPNILSLTDGLLNDILGFQIIATFNTQLTNIDEALLRGGRLLSRKEFKTLSKEDSAKLIEYLGLELTPIDGMVLSEIYAQKYNNETIFHGFKEKKDDDISNYIL